MVSTFYPPFGRRRPDAGRSGFALAALSALLAAAAMGPGPLRAASPPFQLISIPNDDSLRGLLKPNHLVAEGRIGDVSIFPVNKQEKEMGLQGGNVDPSPLYTDFFWINGLSLPFAVDYDGQVVSFRVGGRVLQKADSQAITDVYLRAYALEGGSASSLTGLSLGDTALGQDVVATGANGLRTTRVALAQPTKDLRLAGRMDLAWAGTPPPERSQLAFQVKLEHKCEPPFSHNLRVPLFGQENGNWCWAASGAMIMGFLGGPIRQCVEANDNFGRTDCCDIPTPAPCDSGSLPKFARYGFKNTLVSSPLSFDQVKEELYCFRRPFYFSWRWTGGGGHGMVAVGYYDRDGLQKVVINDPWPPGHGSVNFVSYADWVKDDGHELVRQFYRIRK